VNAPGPTKLAIWRERVRPYVDDLCDMFKGCDAFTQKDHDREMRHVFGQIARRYDVRHNIDRGYIRAIFSDAIAREMGWTRGRLDECAERTLQRELEAAGQIRIPGS
jgi:hypothetical protein